MTQGLTIQHEQLKAVFPFHIVIDSQLCVVSCGDSLHKLFPAIESGSRWTEHFELRRPRIKTIGYESLCQLAMQVVIVQSKSAELRFRQQFVPLDNHLLIVGSPCFSHPNEAQEHGIHLRDFAPHDPTPDMWFMIQGKTAALEDARKMAFNLRKTSAQLRRAVQDASFANRAKSVFLSNVSHELRTPMTAILGYAEMLADELAQERHQDFVQIILDQGRHLLSIMDNVLDLSRLESGTFTIPEEQVQIFDLLRELEAHFTPKAKAKHLRLTIRCHAAVPAELMTNRSRLRQILFNLVGNAVKFTETGSIEVTIESVVGEGTRQIVFTVTDTGIGISDDEREAIFRPFLQVDGTPSRRFGGAGLGLTIAKRLAEMMHGEILFESTPGIGSTFTLTLPCMLPARAPSPAPKVAQAARPSVPSQPTGKKSRFMPPRLSETPAPSRQAESPVPKPLTTATTPTPSDGRQSYPNLNCRILLAEDFVVTQELVKRLLQLAGAETVVASNGREAIDLMESSASEPFDLILMDMQMPEMDGCTATTALREAGYNLPIVALTANTAEEDRQACLGAGCDDFLTKPIDRQQLFSVIAKYLGVRTV